jgi:hypothetical protein
MCIIGVTLSLHAELPGCHSQDTCTAAIRNGFRVLHRSLCNGPGAARGVTRTILECTRIVREPFFYIIECGQNVDVFTRC